MILLLASLLSLASSALAKPQLEVLGADDIQTLPPVQSSPSFEVSWHWETAQSESNTAQCLIFASSNKVWKLISLITYPCHPLLSVLDCGLGVVLTVIFKMMMFLLYCSIFCWSLIKVLTQDDGNTGYNPGSYTPLSRYSALSPSGGSGYNPGNPGNYASLTRYSSLSPSGESGYNPGNYAYLNRYSKWSQCLKFYFMGLGGKGC